MKNVKITIITISYNAEFTIEDTIKSVEMQHYNNLEYIIVDAMSTDHTLDIVSQYKHIVTKIICEKDRGISDAFNKGISNATGELIGIINADDILCKGALEKIAKAYEANIDVYRCNIYKWNPDKNLMLEVIPSMDLIPRGQKIIVAHPGTFVNRKAYSFYGNYDINCKTMMDYELLIRFAREGANIKYIPEYVACFRIGGITTNNKKVLLNTKKEILERKYVLRKNGVYEPIVFYESIRIILKNIVKYFFKLY